MLFRSVKLPSVVLPFSEDRQPAQTCLCALKNQHLEQAVILVDRNAPFVIVVSHIKRIATAPFASALHLNFRFDNVNMDRDKPLGTATQEWRLPSYPILAIILFDSGVSRYNPAIIVGAPPFIGQHYLTYKSIAAYTPSAELHALSHRIKCT